MIVATNPRQELSEFYPPPYTFLAPPRRPKNFGLGQTTSGLVSSSAGTAGSLLSAAGIVAGGLGPAGAIAGAALAVTALIASMFKGCGSTCILTTNEVNQVEPYMQQNLSEYLAAPVSAATQQEAINNFNTLWQGVVTYCSQASLGSAGKNCISDRQNGSCAYKTSPGGWNQSNGVWTYTYPGANGSGSTCWNWFVGYLDPIQNDPRVSAASGTSGGGSGSGLNLGSLILPAAVIGGGILLAIILGDVL